MAVIDHPGFTLADADLVVLSQPDEDGTVHRFHLHKSVLAPLLLHESLKDCKDNDEISLNHAPQELELLFVKLYEGHKQHKIDAPGVQDLDFVDLAVLAHVLEKFCLAQQAKEIKAMLKYQLHRSILPSDTTQFKPLLQTLEVVSSLNDPVAVQYVIDAIYEHLGSVHLMPHYTTLIKELDASNIPPHLWKELLLRCMPVLLACHTDHQKHTTWASRITKLLELMCQPVSCSTSHGHLACWVGTALPAWEAASMEALAELWGNSSDCKSIFEDKDRQKELLCKLRSGNYGNCDDCAKAIKDHVSKIESLRKVWLIPEDLAPSAAPSNEVPDAETDQDEEASSSALSDYFEPIINSTIYKRTIGSIAVLSKAVDGQQTRYFISRKLFSDSEILSDKIKHTSSPRVPMNMEIQIDLMPHDLETLLSVLHHEGLPRQPGESTGYLMFNRRLPVAYVLLEEYKFTDHASAVRGVLRQQLHQSYGETSHHVDDLLHLLQYATEKSDVVIGDLALMGLSRLFERAQLAGLGKEIFTDVASDTLSPSSWQTMLVKLLERLVTFKTELEATQQKLLVLWSAIDALSAPIHTMSSHIPYACWKLKCLPSWEQTKISALRLILASSYTATTELPSQMNLAGNKGPFLALLENIDTGSPCSKCDMTMKYKIRTVRRAFKTEGQKSVDDDMADADSLKRKRSEQDEEDEEDEERRRKSSTPFSEIL